MKKKMGLFGILSLLPGFANAADEIKISDTEIKQIMLLPGESVPLTVNGKQIILTHRIANKIINISNSKEISEQAVGVKIHEESGVVDFSSLDGISVRVPFNKISKTVPNIAAAAAIGRYKNETNTHR